MSRKRWIWIGVPVAVAITLGLAAWSLRDQIAYAQLATSFAAKQTCSCIHVSGRDLESCLAEFPEDAQAQISVTPDGETVRAAFLFGAVRAEAVFEDGYGCRILD